MQRDRTLQLLRTAAENDTADPWDALIADYFELDGLSAILEVLGHLIAKYRWSPAAEVIKLSYDDGQTLGQAYDILRLLLDAIRIIGRGDELAESFPNGDNWEMPLSPKAIAWLRNIHPAAQVLREAERTVAMAARPRCGATTAKGSPCQFPVPSDAKRCWKHAA